MTSWNLADLWDAISDALSDSPALINGSDTRTWAEVEGNANAIARYLCQVVPERQSTVAQYLYNSNEYLESIFAIFKAGLAPVNTNYRYQDEELIYLWNNAEVSAVIFHGTFSEKVEVIRDKVPSVKSFLWVDDGSGEKPDWAVNYHEIARSDPSRFFPSWGRSGDDLYLLYTGGTTGMPKGVMWRQDDLFANLNSSNFRKWTEDSTPGDIASQLKERGTIHVPACPLMHGTGAFTSFACLMGGGTVVTLSSRTFNPAELLDTIDREGVQTLAIVGDAFAKPILAELDRNTTKWSLASLFAIVSSGVMWSEETKTGLLKHKSSLLLADLFSSSEALGMGASVSSGNKAQPTATFTLGDRAVVIDEDNKVIEKGSNIVGRLALRGRNPIGYYKDPEKSSMTFPVIDGVRFSVPGDYATVDNDGTIHLLGRGSVCINTGGEKVFPEEVEEVIKKFPNVIDAIAVGIPDNRFGEVVSAVVQLKDNSLPVTPEDVIAFVREHLAAYKAPRTVLFVDSIERSPSGKVDYSRWKQVAISTFVK